MQFTEADVERVQAARSGRSRFSLGPLFTPAKASPSAIRLPLAEERPQAATVALLKSPAAQQTNGGSIANGSVVDTGNAPGGTASEMAALRCELQEARRRYSTAEALLQKADQVGKSPLPDATALPSPSYRRNGSPPRSDSPPPPVATGRTGSPPFPTGRKGSLDQARPPRLPYR